MAVDRTKRTKAVRSMACSGRPAVDDALCHGRPAVDDSMSDDTRHRVARPSQNQLVLPFELDSKGFRMMSDTHGRIAEVCMVNHDHDTKRVIFSLMGQMGPSVRFKILAYDDAEAKGLRQELHDVGLADRPVTITSTEGAANPTHHEWMRDLLTMYQSGSHTAGVPTTLSSPRFVRRVINDDGRFFRLMDEYSLLSPGGFAVATDKKVLCSPDIVGLMDVTPENAVERMSAAAGKPVEIIEPPYPERDSGDVRSLYPEHIDMWATPLGPTYVDGEPRDNILVVGNPLWGARLLRSLPKSEKQYFSFHIMPQVKADDREAMSVDYWADLVEGVPGLHGMIEDYPDMMRERGHDVRWIPYLPLPERGQTNMAVTYNNVLQENYIGGDGAHVRNVWTPTYSLRTLDMAAHDVYGKLGYSVRPVDGFEEYVCAGGSERCLTVVLRRGRFDERLP
ncbi:MAG: hypothetical protein GF416_04065 [Candidatus Altiarchaeales archaeon]|nr:hypothetical protein [Candidatus Altiarchaeales archaeon]MBD3416295.1 hypothetical protein [Candidatus Altiarchaeales archaeon]